MTQKIEAGGSITLRVPVHAPKHVIDYLSKLRQTESRGFSPQIFKLIEKGILIETSNQNKVGQPSLSSIPPSETAYYTKSPIEISIKDDKIPQTNNNETFSKNKPNEVNQWIDPENF